MSMTDSAASEHGRRGGKGEDYGEGQGDYDGTEGHLCPRHMEK